MTDIEEDKGCAAEIYPGSYYDQPSYCDDDVEPGSDYCAKHRAWAEDYEAYDPDEARDRALDAAYEEGF